MRRNSLIAVLIVLLLVLAGILYVKATFGVINIPRAAPGATSTTETMRGFTLPAGFSIDVFASDVPDARTMVFDPTGSILVSEPSQGRVVALTDTDGDGDADRKDTVISGLRRPHGLAYDCTSSPCMLYIAEENAVASYQYDSETKKASEGQNVAELPGGGGHSSRTIMFLPSPNESILLISVGSSCNVCNESDDRRAKILAYDTKTQEVSEYATGLRNSVFMSIHPVSGKIWATEMGRDNLGDDVPPDEINIIERGKNYGWPFCYGNKIHDGNFDPEDEVSCANTIASKVDLQAHSAPLGIEFIPEEGWPEEWWYDAIVAYHGSWNRSVPTGYKLVRIPLDAQGNSEGPIQDFITGFMRADGKTIGRPVALLIQPGGTMYISDDQAGVIYKVSRSQ